MMNVCSLYCASRQTRKARSKLAYELTSLNGHTSDAALHSQGSQKHYFETKICNLQTRSLAGFFFIDKMKF